MRVVIAFSIGQFDALWASAVRAKELEIQARAAGFQAAFQRAQGYPQAGAMEATCRQAELDGTEAILFLNGDLEPEPGALVELLRLNIPLASGLYFGLDFPHFPQVFRKLSRGDRKRLIRKEPAVKAAAERDLYRSIEQVPNAPFPADMVGNGCLLVRREVWQTCGQELFVHHYHEDGSAGEQYHFSRVAARSFPLIVHPGVTCRRLALAPLGRQQCRLTAPFRMADWAPPFPEEQT